MDRREIKFRGWCNQGKTMYSWERLLESYHTLNSFFEDEIYSWDEVDNDYSWERMQYTGLKDRLGREIYEGDIVRVTYESDGEIEEEYLGVVKFGKCRISYTSEAPQHETIGFYIETSLRDDEKQVGLFQDHNIIDGKAFNQVIGNIFENPELLEKSCK